MLTWCFIALPVSREATSLLSRGMTDSKTVFGPFGTSWGCKCWQQRERSPVEAWLIPVLRVIAMWCILDLDCWMPVMPRVTPPQNRPLHATCYSTNGIFYFSFVLGEKKIHSVRLLSISCLLLPAALWQPGTCGTAVPRAHFSCLMVHISRCLGVGMLNIFYGVQLCIRHFCIIVCDFFRSNTVIMHNSSLIFEGTRVIGSHLWMLFAYSSRKKKTITVDTRAEVG